MLLSVHFDLSINKNKSFSFNIFLFRNRFSLNKFTFVLYFEKKKMQFSLLLWSAYSAFILLQSKESTSRIYYYYAINNDMIILTISITISDYYHIRFDLYRIFKASNCWWDQKIWKFDFFLLNWMLLNSSSLKFILNFKYIFWRTWCDLIMFFFFSGNHFHLPLRFFASEKTDFLFWFHFWVIVSSVWWLFL